MFNTLCRVLDFVSVQEKNKKNEFLDRHPGIIEYSIAIQSLL